MPVYVIHGTVDQIVPVEQAQALAQAIQGKSSFYYLEMAGGQHHETLAEWPRGIAWVMKKLKAKSAQHVFLN